MTDLRAFVHFAICFGSFEYWTLEAPMSRHTFCTASESFSTTSGSPSTSIMQSASQSGRPALIALFTARMQVLSISSVADGSNGVAMSLDTHFPASSNVPKAATIMADDRGFGDTLRVISVIMPRVPSLPTNSRSSWYPTSSSEFGSRPPSLPRWPRRPSVRGRNPLWPHT